MEEVEICYRNNPNEPEIVCEARIFGTPNLYNLYKSREEMQKKHVETEDNKNEKKDIL